MSRQLRQEALPLYCSRNTFDFEYHLRFGIHWSRNGWGYRLLDDFQKIGSDRLNWIRSIVVDTLYYFTEMRISINSEGNLTVSCHLWKSKPRGPPGRNLTLYPPDWRTLVELNDDQKKSLINGVEQDSEQADSEVLSGAHLIRISTKIKLELEGRYLAFTEEEWPRQSATVIAMDDIRRSRNLKR